MHRGSGERVPLVASSSSSASAAQARGGDVETRDAGLSAADEPGVATCGRLRCSRRNLLVWVLTVLVVVFGTVNRVMYKIMTVPMKCYTYFLSIFNSSCYVVLYFTILFVRYRLGAVTPTMMRETHPCARTQIRLLIVGLCDALGFLLGVIAAAQISGPLVVMLPQTTILFTIIVTFVLLRQRYSLLQCLAAFVILGGVLVTVVPDALSGSGGTDASLTGYYVMYCLSTLPNAVSFSLKELIFRDFPGLDIFVVNSFGSLWQVVSNFLLLPTIEFSTASHGGTGNHTNVTGLALSAVAQAAASIDATGAWGLSALPRLVEAAYVGAGNASLVCPSYTAAQAGAYLVDAASCFAGNAVPALMALNAGQPHLSNACIGPAASLIYTVINLTWNIMLLLLLKFGGAFYMFIAITASLPLAENLFLVSWPLLPAHVFEWNYLVGLFIIVGGVIMYRASSMLKERREARLKQRLVNSGEPLRQPCMCLCVNWAGCCELPRCGNDD